MLHLPVAGIGDGGITSTARDVHVFWRAMFAGRIVGRDFVTQFTAAYTDEAASGLSYGLGFWLEHDGPGVILEGADAGVSFRSIHDPTRDITATVISNTTEGAWLLANEVQRALR